MHESSNTTVTNTGVVNSRLSFYEYPSHKPYINSIHQPLRPSPNLSKTVSLPESNRDQLLTSLQALSLKIKTLENERKNAELNLHEITGCCSRSPTRRREPQTTIDEQLKQAEENFRHLQHQHKRIFQVLNEHRPSPKTRSTRKKKRSRRSRSYDSGIILSEGRHHHLDLNDVPFILGQSTSPSHNLKSNVQNVIALLKNHNKKLCLSSKEYADLLYPRHKNQLTPHTLLYLDHYNKPSNRPSSASPVRTTRRPTTIRRPQTASNSTTITTDNQSYSRIKHLRREYVVLSREHAKLNSSHASSDDLELIGRRMNAILEELGQLQRQSLATSQDHTEQDLNETPNDTLKRTKLLQLILKDPINKQQKH